jgi:membrane-associated phospholipid phosphatase
VSATLDLAIAALSLAALFVVVGLYVAHRPLSRLDAEAVYFRGQLTPLALVFTISGRSRALTASCIIAIAVYALMHLPILIPLAITAMQLVSQIIVEYCKTLFTRMRPDYWLVGLEAGHSYPSGHSTTAIVFFTGWSVVVALSALPGEIKTALIALFTVWALGIMWSRLALGAHYFSDVCGGAVFGAAWLCASIAFLLEFHGIPR